MTGCIAVYDNFVISSADTQDFVGIEEGSFGGTSDDSGHCVGVSLSHSVPVHQSSCSANSMGKRPLEAQSVGF